MSNNEFRPREVYVSSGCLRDLPLDMQKHVYDGNRLWMVGEPENGRTFISVDDNISHGFAVVAMSNIAQEVTVTQTEINRLTGYLGDHARGGGKLYMIGEPKDGLAMVSAHPEVSLDFAFVNARSVELVDDFTDAVASIGVEGEHLEQ